MTKRNRQKIKERNSEESIEIVSFIKVILVVIILIAGVYLFTRIFVTKDLFNKNTGEDETTPEVEIKYDSLSLGMLFNRPYNDYYVIIYDSEDTEGGYYQILADTYATLEDSIKIYRVDLNSPFNESYVSDETNPKATKASELKVKNGTLIKIRKGKITKYLEDKEDIAKELEKK